MILGLFCLSLPLICLRLQMGGLGRGRNIWDLVMIDPLFALHQDSRLIHSESRDGRLILDRVFILTFLRVFRKGELNLHLSSIFMRHDDGGKKEQKSSLKSALYPKGLMGPQP